MLAVLLAIATAPFAAVKAQNCDPVYECKFHYQTKSHLWYYDFENTCDPQNPGQWSDNTRTDSMEYFYQVCGTVTEPCGAGVVDLGTVIQRFEGSTGPVCEVLGHGAPLYSPWPQPNPDVPPPGINITFLGQSVNDNDHTLCPVNTQDDVRPGRQVVFRIACDQSVNGIHVTRVTESPTCFYNVWASSKYACAVRYTGPDASTDPTGDPDQVIGLDGGAAFGCVVGGAALAFFVWAGVGYARNGRLPFLSGGGVGGSSASSGFGTGLASAPSPAFSGSSSGVGTGGGYGQVG